MTTPAIDTNSPVRELAAVHDPNGTASGRAFKIINLDKGVHHTVMFTAVSNEAHKSANKAFIIAGIICLIAFTALLVFGATITTTPIIAIPITLAAVGVTLFIVSALGMNFSDKQRHKSQNFSNLAKENASYIKTIQTPEFLTYLETHHHNSTVIKGSDLRVIYNQYQTHSHLPPRI